MWQRAKQFTDVVNVKLDRVTRGFNAGRRWRFVFMLLIVSLGLFVVYQIADKIIIALDPDKPVDADFEKYLVNDGISKSKSIPKIIHQIWTDDILPDQFVKHVQSLTKYNQHPEWEYFFWTLDIGREFLQQKYPKLMNIYEASDKITKADILRILVIYHYGGCYFDLDIVGVRPLDRFVENHECSLVAPIPEFFVAYETQIDYRAVNNAIFLCRAGHPFFELLVKRTEKRSMACNSTCEPPEYPSPLLIELTDKGDTNNIPEFVEYELFDSKYDMGITKRLTTKCYEEYKTLEPAKQLICDNWKKHGEGDRKISENAYTFHTWYHANARKVTTDPKNRISNIVPHVKMFNRQ